MEQKTGYRRKACYLLQKYAEKLGVSNPYNPVTFVKNFMKEETYVNTTYAEMSAIDTAEEYCS